VSALVSSLSDLEHDLQEAYETLGLEME